MMINKLIDEQVERRVDLIDLNKKFDKIIKVLFGDLDNIDSIGLIARFIETEKTVNIHIEQHEKTKLIFFRWFLSGGFATCIAAIIGKHIESIKNIFSK